jgi:ABC-type bacteriocin/lantibiotic exporter with double-glycine peptidase domain
MSRLLEYFDSSSTLVAINRIRLYFGIVYVGNKKLVSFVIDYLFIYCILLILALLIFTGLGKVALITCHLYHLLLILFLLLFNQRSNQLSLQLLPTLLHDAVMFDIQELRFIFFQICFAVAFRD